MTDKMLIDRSVVEQALEALKAAVSDDQPYIVKSKEAVATLRAALEQQQVEQEPVAWIYQNSNTDKEYLVWCKSEMGGRNWRPLYAHPQPPRQPLTDVQIQALADAHMEAFAQFVGAGEVWFEGEKEFARAIERAHGIIGE